MRFLNKIKKVYNVQGAVKPRKISTSPRGYRENSWKGMQHRQITPKSSFRNHTTSRDTDRNPGKKQVSFSESHITDHSTRQGTGNNSVVRRNYIKKTTLQTELKDVLLFGVQISMKERDLQDRIDVTYPFTKISEKGKIIEVLQQPPKYDIQFLYHKQQNKQQTPTFLITAQRVNKSEDYYEIEISGEK